MSNLARIVEAPDRPHYEDLVELTLEQRAELPARFHIPRFDADGTPQAWLCAVCWDDVTVSQWPCKTAQENGREVFQENGTETDDQRYIRTLRQQITDLRDQARTAENDLRSLRERAAQEVLIDTDRPPMAISEAISDLPLTIDTP